MTPTKIVPTKIKGYSVTCFASIIQSQDATLFTILIFGLSIVNVIYHNIVNMGTNNIMGIIYAGIIILIFREIFNLIINIFHYGFIHFIKTIKKMFFNIFGWGIFLYGIIDGPLGSSCYIIANSTAGVMVAAIYSVLPIIFTALGNNLFLKEKIYFYGWFGIILAIGGAIFFNILINSHTLHMTYGIIIGMFTPIFWGFGGTFINFLYQKSSSKQFNIKAPETLTYALFSSSIFSIFCMLPFATIILTKNHFAILTFFNNGFNNIEFFSAILIIGFSTYFMRVGFYYGTYHLNAIKTIIIIASGVAFTPIIMIIYSHFGNMAYEVLKLQLKNLHWYNYLLSLVIILGTIITIKFQSSTFKNSKKFFLNI